MTPRTFLPREKAGRVALWFTTAGFASWLILPAVTTLFRETFPITDTVVMPIIGVAMITIASVVNFITYVFLRQRSVANLICFSLTVVFTIFSATFLIGEGLSGI